MVPIIFAFQNSISASSEKINEYIFPTISIELPIKAKKYFHPSSALNNLALKDLSILFLTSVL